MKTKIISLLFLVLVFSCNIFAESQDPVVKAFEEKILKARPLHLSKVRLLGGPLKQAQDVTEEYLLQLEPDRMLAGYRSRAGLEPKGEGYGGLRDAFRYTGNPLELELEIKFVEWAERILAPLDAGQIQRMLNTEFGGMNEIMVDLYADTGNKRWLDLSYKFEHRSFIEPLKRHQDILAGKHGNTQVPKLIGSADRYAYTGSSGDFLAASFFWDQVVQQHSYATGGHGHDEYFGEPGKLSERVDGRTAETCNVYNMVKLTRRLFSIRPDAHYADFLERALFNHILASIDPEDGRTCYMVPVGRGVQHEYQGMFRSFTCCVGSGMESHALYGDGIYYQGKNRLWINLYAPCRRQAYQSSGSDQKLSPTLF